MIIKETKIYKVKGDFRLQNSVKLRNQILYHTTDCRNRSFLQSELKNNLNNKLKHKNVKNTLRFTYSMWKATQ